MPSHRDLEDLDAITQYFANRSLEEFERDEAEATPPMPIDAVDRPPARGPRSPTRLESELDSLKQRLAVVETEQKRLK
ncbi:MAG TPA: hypothetical protein VKM93_14940 [Terriglobia bacterium]|nr:hypothetical protein [Terriglobia bacterium]